jgi:hypothetical protein
VPHEEIHVSKDTWCNQRMTSVKLNQHFRYVKIMNQSDMCNYSSRDMSTSDVSKLRHSESFASRVLPPALA